MIRIQKKMKKFFLENNLPKEAGLTLIELLIVFSLLGGLIALLVTNLTGQADKAKVDQTKIAFGQLTSNLQLYRVNVGKYPTTEQGLKALVANPGDNKNWRGPYTEENKLKDPWGNDIQYSSDGKSFKLISPGIDGNLGTDDDIVYPENAKTDGQ